jgi:plasmid stabilization system protein ParE
MRKIHWNNQAKSDYFENIDFLLERWTEKEAQEFIDEVHETEFILKQGNVDFQDTDFVRVKRCVIRKQISLFYRVIDENNIEFLRFWNNHQNRNKLKL